MPKKQGASEEFVLSEVQAQKLWSQCLELDDKVLVGLMMWCGMRVSEAIHLKANWIRNEEINIPSRMACNCWGCGRRGYWKPKSRAGIRQIAIPGFLKPLLEAYLSKRPEGLKLTRQSAWYKVQQFAEKASLPHIFPHALRATAATTLASKGFTGVELCSYFGWSRLDMGEHYIRISEARAGAKAKIKQIYG